VSAPLLAADVRSLSWQYAELLSTRKASCAPSPVTSHASSIVQVSRWANGTVLGSAALGSDGLTCEGCSPSFLSSIVSHLLLPSCSHKARPDKS